MSDAVDWIIIAFTLLLAARGYLRGFVVGVLSLAGFVIGAVLGAHVGPIVLTHGSHSSYAPLFSLGGALLIGGVLGAVSETIGLRARRLLFIPGLKLIDGIAGALLGACLALGVAWIVGAVLVQASDSPSLHHDVAQSTILHDLNSFLPPSGPILDSLSRIDPLPSVNGPGADVPAPDPRIISAGGVIAASASVVRIQGEACGLGVEGSGWVAGPSLVVTNAHVVAGEHDTTVQIGGDGASMPADVVLFDPHNDIAVLYVPGLHARALSFAADTSEGTSAAILGYPEDGPFDIQPGRLGDTRSTSTQDAYGNGPVVRDITALRGLVRPGNSGGPMIDAAGQVVATIFAQVTNAPHDRPGGFAVPDSVVASELGKVHDSHQSVSTQSCAD